MKTVLDRVNFEFKPTTITEEYRRTNERMHETTPEFGTSGQKYAQKVQMAYIMTGCESLLDYGCGKATLADSLPQIKVTNYDPAMPRFSARPQPCDMVACTDVMEHIEPECIDAVLDDIKSLAKKTVFFSIATRPARKTLPDGRNAHISIHDYLWWTNKIAARWRIGMMVNHEHGEVELTCYTENTQQLIMPNEIIAV